MEQIATYHDQIDELVSYIDSIADKETALIQVLHKAQNLFGYIPTDVQLIIGEELNIPASKVFGVVSFYTYFTTEPKGKYVFDVCMGTACFVRNSAAVVKELEKALHIKMGETTPDHKYTIESLRCVGACGLAPVVMVNHDVYGRVTPEDVAKIVAKYMD